MKRFPGLRKLRKVVKEYDYKDYYYVSDRGDVWKVLFDKNGNITSVLNMKPFISKDGYVEYVLTLKNGKKKHTQAQRLVGNAWVNGKSKTRIEVNHIDGNRQNNYYENLKWVTKSENIRHSFDVLGKQVWNKGKKIKKTRIIKSTRIA